MSTIDTQEELMADLHCHTDYSQLRMLDSIIKVNKLIDKSVEYNKVGCAITDHESLSGHVQAIQYVKEGKKKGTIPKDFKLILGNEIYLTDYIRPHEELPKYSGSPFYHFILLSKDEIGHRQLRELSTRAWENSYFTGKMQRVPTTKQDLIEVIGDNKGHLIASTACIGGELGRAILKTKRGFNQLPFYDDKDIQDSKVQGESELFEFIDFCKDIFGDDFFLEIQPSFSEDQIIVNKTIITISEYLNIPISITTDIHYLMKEQESIHASYLNSKNDVERELGDFYGSTYMMKPDELHKYLDEQIGAENVSKGLKNTVDIANRIEEYDLYHGQIVPKATIPEFEMSHSFIQSYEECEYIKKFAYSENISDQYFLYLIEQGWWGKEFSVKLSTEEIKSMIYRINDELEAIWETSVKIEDNVASYYLTALEIVNMMWEDTEGNSLVGCSRGSIACFYTAYLIGLQQINPLTYDIPYWRHLDKSRPEMPDVDIDTEASKRQNIIEATRRKYGYDKVLNICTFKTEGSKSAIQTAGRGLGIDSDITSFISGMIPVVRGATTSLTVMINGDEENGVKPNKEFINECARYEGLLETAMSIEGLICGRSIHASGVIIFDKNYVNHNCMMKAPNGQPTTQWSMDDSSYCGGLKFDYLTISNLDSMRLCMDLLVKHKYIEWKGSLKETYNAYFHPDVIDYETVEMWKMAEELEIINLFQFQTQVGSQAIRKIKPRSLIELGVANSIMRLVAGEDATEQPIDTYVRYKNNIEEWYSCMRDKYTLTEEEITIAEKYLKLVCGMATMQEEVMKIVMDEKTSNFNMKDANYLRKSIAKKKKKLQAEAKEKFYKDGLANGTSENLLNYIWDECIKPQLGYSFSLPHVLGYSTIAVQEMNMAYHFPVILWNVANLIVDSGSNEDNEDNKATKYGKVASAIANIKDKTNISLPLINEAEFGFKPDIENNRIIFGFKGLCGVGDDIAKAIIENRPYSSLEDFCTRMVDTKIVGNSVMSILIKAGCFTELHGEDRVETMKEFINRNVFVPSDSVNFQNFKKLQEYDIIPDSLKEIVRIRNFKNYVLFEDFLYKNIINPDKKVPACGYHDRLFKLDKGAMEYFRLHFSEDSIEEVVKESYVISEKRFTKEWNTLCKPLVEWMEEPKTLEDFNQAKFNAIWEKLASGTVSSWEMESLSFYYSEHELANLNEELYSVENYNELPEIPEYYDSYVRYFKTGAKTIYKNRISRLAGTVLDSDNNKNTITLLTCYGVVTVKFSKGQYNYYSKRISEKLDETKDKKTVLENSWFKRGNKIFVCGFRNEDIFKAHRYQDSIFSHTVNLITDINEDGTATVKSSRVEI